MALAEAPPKAPRTAAKPVVAYGHPRPRIGPPLPARSDLAGFRQAASDLGIELMPWQETAARYITAKGPDGKRLFSEVGIVVARQQGKTWLMKPHIVRSLKAGRKIMHIAQTRELPRVMFDTIADALSQEPELFPKRRGKTIWPRYGQGQEEIKLTNGGIYRIAAGGRGGARGWSIDDLILDEIREMESWDVIAAAGPTRKMSEDPQTIYLSNAGTDASVILNDLRKRGIEGDDPTLAYLEWSAAPERAIDDRDGWAEANPALGHYPQALRSLEEDFRKLPAPVFETEDLCRWVKTLKPALVTAEAWAKGNGGLSAVNRPVVAVSLHPSGARASAVAAWQMPNGSIGVRVLADVTGSPIDVARLGRDLLPLIGVARVSYHPMTDGELAKHLRRTVAVKNRDLVTYSATFARMVEGGQVRWDGEDIIGADLAWMTRNELDSGAWLAVPIDDERPVTAALAAVRAVGMAAGPAPKPLRLH